MVEEKIEKLQSVPESTEEVKETENESVSDTEKVEATTIASTEGGKVVETGDTHSMTIYLVCILAAAMIGTGAFCVVRRKRI